MQEIQNLKFWAEVFIICKVFTTISYIMPLNLSREITPLLLQSLLHKRIQNR